MPKSVCSNVKVMIADDEHVDGKVRACFFFMEVAFTTLDICTGRHQQNQCQSQISDCFAT